MLHTTQLRRLAQAVLAGVLLWLAAPASAPARPAGTERPGTPRSTLAPGQEVQVKVEACGVGDTLRPGDWAGVRLALTDTSDRPREVAVRLHITDSDGDTCLYTRVVTLNPATPMGVWLYPRMPWEIRQGSWLTVSVCRATVQENEGVIVGRQIGSARISPVRVVAPQDSLIAVIGAGGPGLEQYAQTYKDRPYSPTSHELSQVVGGLTPGALPDRWQGWGAFETLVWSQADPGEITGDQKTEAIIEWVNRGGHLVIVLPGVGNPWTGSNNPLASLLPAVKIERLPEVDLESYRTLLVGTASEVRPLPRRAAIHRFVIPEDTDVRDATPVIDGPDGCIVARRLVGVGMVTVVGIDLGSRSLAQGQAVRADAFWNRILGRRCDTLTTAEIEKSGTATTAYQMGSMLWIDDHIAGVISRGRRAGIGVLLGLVVFAAYWLLAGPVGFGLLRARGLERHAWVLFLGASGLFTLVAWAGASAMRPKQEAAWHYTLLDHVYGQPVQRARAYLSVLLPRYGEERVVIGEPGADAAWNQALSPWADPGNESRMSFPDARPYTADTRRMWSLTVPARSTIKQFQADWLGGPRWSMPVPTSLEERPQLRADGRLVGSLTHALPGPLEDVQVILVRRQTPEEDATRAPGEPGRLRAEVYAWTPGPLEPGLLPGRWAPDQVMHLDTFKIDQSADAGPLLDRIIPRVSLTGAALGGLDIRGSVRDELEALYPMLKPPDAKRSAGTGSAPAVLQRRLTHTWDLGKWFTQPCLIVLGHIDGVPSPIPLAVDGRPLDATGDPGSRRTVVRWIYPLSPDPPRFGARRGTPPAPAVTGPGAS